MEELQRQLRLLYVDLLDCVEQAGAWFREGKLRADDYTSVLRSTTDGLNNLKILAVNFQIDLNEPANAT